MKKINKKMKNTARERERERKGERREKPLLQQKKKENLKKVASLCVILSAFLILIDKFD